MKTVLLNKAAFGWGKDRMVGGRHSRPGWGQGDRPSGLCWSRRVGRHYPAKEGSAILEEEGGHLEVWRAQMARHGQGRATWEGAPLCGGITKACRETHHGPHFRNQQWKQDSPPLASCLPFLACGQLKLATLAVAAPEEDQCVQELQGPFRDGRHLASAE